ncbi:MAG TPA: BadF/BadG/BcrA/BcrD ATPase family protein [Gemmatimonadales bacterium]|nr:BadF/BadG/BcrA/BcrD ATPase family protein [Gemmatimonadales bacterium]
MTGLLVGADVGGTKTTVAVAAGDSGHVLARASGAGAALRPGRALASSSTIAELVRRALGDAGQLNADVLVVGAAGAGREPERDELQAALRSEGLAKTVVVTTDVEIALIAAFGDRPGIVVSAGTGSIAVARDRNGQLHRLGGYGWQMGDEGSGYAIGRAALGAASRARDGRSPATALERRMLEAARCADFDALVRWAASATPGEVASLAPHVLEVAAAGDPVAQGIADYAARELSLLALLLAERLPDAEPIPVALTGGLLETVPTLRRAVLAKVADQPSLRPLGEPVDAVLGAITLAARRQR